MATFKETAAKMMKESLRKQATDVAQSVLGKGALGKAAAATIRKKISGNSNKDPVAEALGAQKEVQKDTTTTLQRIESIASNISSNIAKIAATMGARVEVLKDMKRQQAVQASLDAARAEEAATEAKASPGADLVNKTSDKTEEEQGGTSIKKSMLGMIGKLGKVGKGILAATAVATVGVGAYAMSGGDEDASDDAVESEAIPVNDVPGTTVGPEDAPADLELPPPDSGAPLAPTPGKLPTVPGSSSSVPRSESSSTSSSTGGERLPNVPLPEAPPLNIPKPSTPSSVPGSRTPADAQKTPAAPQPVSKPAVAATPPTKDPQVQQLRERLEGIKENIEDQEMIYDINKKRADAQGGTYDEDGNKKAYIEKMKQMADAIQSQIDDLAGVKKGAEGSSSSITITPGGGDSGGATPSSEAAPAVPATPSPSSGSDLSEASKAVEVAFEAPPAPIINTAVQQQTTTGDQQLTDGQAPTIPSPIANRGSLDDGTVFEAGR